MRHPSPHHDLLPIDLTAALAQEYELRTEARDPGACAAALVTMRVGARAGASAAGVALDAVRDDASSARAGGGVVARGEVLVRADAELVHAVAHRHRLRPLGRLGDVHRLLTDDGCTDRALDVCARLRSEGITAQPDYAVIAGHIIKRWRGPGAPRRTELDPGERDERDRRGQGCRVAVVDTPVGAPDVTAARGWLDGLDAEAGQAADGSARNVTGHGAFVCGLIRRLAPASTLTLVAGLARDGVGTDFSVAAALHRLAARSAVDVVNLSLVAASDLEQPVCTEAALAAVASRHPAAVVLAASGNDGADGLRWPAAAGGVHAVAALLGDRRAAFSNADPSVAVWAPGAGVVSTHGGCPPAGVTGAFSAWSGTSFATAWATGTLAALMSQGLTAREALDRIRSESPDAGNVRLAG
jgi:hypothetical protein